MTSITSSIFYSKRDKDFIPVYPGNNHDSDGSTSDDEAEENLHLNVSVNTRGKKNKVLVTEKNSDCESEVSECRWPHQNIEDSSLVIPPSSEEDSSSKRVSKKKITGVVCVDRFKKKPSATAAPLQEVNKTVRRNPVSTSNVRRKLLPQSPTSQSWVPSMRATKLVKSAVATSISTKVQVPGTMTSCLPVPKLKTPADRSTNGLAEENVHEAHSSKLLESKKSNAQNKGGFANTVASSQIPKPCTVIRSFPGKPSYPGPSTTKKSLGQRGTMSSELPEDRWNPDPARKGPGTSLANREASNQPNESKPLSPHSGSVRRRMPFQCSKLGETRVPSLSPLKEVNREPNKSSNSFLYGEENASSQRDIALDCGSSATHLNKCDINFNNVNKPGHMNAIQFEFTPPSNLLLKKPHNKENSSPCENQRYSASTPVNGDESFRSLGLSPSPIKNGTETSEGQQVPAEQPMDSYCSPLDIAFQEEAARSTPPVTRNSRRIVPSNAAHQKGLLSTIPPLEPFGNLGSAVKKQCRNLNTRPQQSSPHKTAVPLQGLAARCRPVTCKSRSSVASNVPTPGLTLNPHSTDRFGNSKGLSNVIASSLQPSPQRTVGVPADSSALELSSTNDAISALLHDNLEGNAKDLRNVIAVTSKPTSCDTASNTQEDSAQESSTTEGATSLQASANLDTTGHGTEEPRNLIVKSTQSNPIDTSVHLPQLQQELSPDVDETLEEFSPNDSSVHLPDNLEDTEPHRRNGNTPPHYSSPEDTDVPLDQRFHQRQRINHQMDPNAPKWPSQK